MPTTVGSKPSIPFRSPNTSTASTWLPFTARAQSGSHPRGQGACGPRSREHGDRHGLAIGDTRAHRQHRRNLAHGPRGWGRGCHKQHPFLRASVVVSSTALSAGAGSIQAGSSASGSSLGTCNIHPRTENQPSWLDWPCNLTGPVSEFSHNQPRNASGVRIDSRQTPPPASRRALLA